MGPEHRRWIAINAVAVTGAVNVVLNALPAWLATRDLDHVPLWTIPLTGGTGVFTDTLGTFLILPFVTTLLCTAAVWRARRAGALRRLRRMPSPVAAIAALPSVLLVRALTFSLFTVALLAAPAALVLALAVPDGLDAGPFVAYKTTLGVGLGLLVTPLIALRAMGDA